MAIANDGGANPATAAHDALGEASLSREIDSAEVRERAELDRDIRRSRALPYIKDGPIPTDRDRDVSEDNKNIWVVLKLFFRAWPYIRPQLFGRWYVFGQTHKTTSTDSIDNNGYSFVYAPILATLIAFTGPSLFNLQNDESGFALTLLYFFIGLILLCLWPLPFIQGRKQIGLSIVLFIAVTLANLVTSFVVPGYADSAYTVLLSVVCIAAWMLRFCRQDGRLKYRMRLSAHLIYYYLIVGTQALIALAMGLVLADLLNQSILQSDPVAPWLASLAGSPELARGVSEGLSVAERHEMKWLYVKIALFLWAVQLPFTIVAPYYRVWILQQINQDLRVALVERWHQLSLKYHSDHRVGDSIYRIYLDSAQVTAVIDRLMGVISALIEYSVAALLVMLLSPTIGMIAFTLLIPAILWGRWAMPRMRTRSLVARAAASDVTSRVQESVGAIRLVKAYGTEERAQQKFEEDSVIAFNAAYRVRSIIALVTIVMFTITASFLLSGEFLMAMWANSGQETFAQELIALVGVSFVIWNLTAYNWSRERLHSSGESMRGIMRQWLSAQDIAMGLSRVFDILDIEPDVQTNENAVPFNEFKQEVRFDSVAFSYQSDRPVLNDVSFTAEPGTVTAIVGPTGSGKSTLMGLLLRLYDPTNGSISIDGRPLPDYQVDSLRQSIAIALQENVLFAISIRDNIRYVSPDASDAQINEAIRVACMDDYIDSLPEGLDTLLGDRGGKLSTGQRQRLSIARAIVRDTPILILDEPTAALDAATEHRVMSNLAEWGKGRAIFLITHRISTIRRADNILYLDEGRVIESGNHDTLMALDDGRYRSFVEAESNLSRTTEGVKSSG
ncbi:MAG: ABC transporter ATP-binding protein [Pseudomonadota bacterium]